MPNNAPTRLLDKRDWIAGLENGLTVIEAFDDQHPRLTASQAGARCGITRTAARRYLLTLEHLGYVGSDGKLFWLTPRILRLGHAYLESARLPRLVQPFLQRIAGATQEVAYLGVLDGDDAVYIARSGAVRHLNTGYVVGARIPAQLSTAGVAIVATRDSAAIESWIATRQLQAFTPYTLASPQALREVLHHIRRQGWAMLEQQLELNSRGIAVPLFDRHHTALGAISITMPINQERAEAAVARVLPAMQEAARALRALI